MDKVEFRPASRDDCLDIARLYRISSEGVADYVWSKLAGEGEDLLKVGEARYQRENTSFSYQNCTIVECDEKVAGMLVAFPMYVDPDDHEEDPVLQPYAELEEDQSLYVCSLALYPEYRGRGWGRELMAIAELRAKVLGLGKVSLIVFEQNVPARTLYEKLGYLETARRKVIPHPLIAHEGNALLLVKSLLPAAGIKPL